MEPDFDRMLWEYRLDGVVITVPNAEKKKLVIAAARAGVAIFLEKPLAVCREDALEMQRAVQEAGVKFYMSDPFVRRYSEIEGRNSKRKAGTYCRRKYPACQ